jgi:hypothetical protein
MLAMQTSRCQLQESFGQFGSRFRREGVQGVGEIHLCWRVCPVCCGMELYSVVMSEFM